MQHRSWRSRDEQGAPTTRIAAQDSESVQRRESDCDVTWAALGISKGALNPVAPPLERLERSLRCRDESCFELDGRRARNNMREKAPVTAS